MIILHRFNGHLDEQVIVLNKELCFLGKSRGKKFIPLLPVL